MIELAKAAPRARIEPVRPAMLALEPAFLTARASPPSSADEHLVRDEATITAEPCPGCGRVHRDRLVRFFQVRWAGPAHPPEHPETTYRRAEPSSFATTPHLAVAPQFVRHDHFAPVMPELA